MKTKKVKTRTGMPFGTFTRRDKHPTIEGLGFAQYMNGKHGAVYESWVPMDNLGNKRKPAKAKKPCRVSYQTGSKRLEIERGAEHPTRSGWVLLCYKKNGKETWASRSSFENVKKHARISRTERPPMEEHVKAHRDGVRREIAAMVSSERAYERAYGKYGRMVERQYNRAILAPHRASKRKAKKRAYRKNNPAAIAAHKLAKKKRRDSLRTEFSALSAKDKSMANDRYKWRDLLNKAHGKIVFVVDHVIPLASGGKHVPCNLAVTTYQYNEWKSDRTDVGVRDFNPIQYHEICKARAQ